MDMSMILGLALAGSIMLLNGNKTQSKKSQTQSDTPSEFVVSVGGDGAISISPKEEALKGVQ